MMMKTSKDKSKGFLSEIYLHDTYLFRRMTGLSRDSMLPIIVNSEYNIVVRGLVGHKGRVIVIDYLMNEVRIEIDENTILITIHKNVEQDNK